MKEWSHKELLSLVNWIEGKDDRIRDLEATLVDAEKEIKEWLDLKGVGYDITILNKIDKVLHRKKKNK